MAKSPNLVETVIITVSTNEPVERYLKRLVHTGEFGKNTAEAAERVIVLGLQTLIDAKRLTRIEPGDEVK